MSSSGVVIRQQVIYTSLDRSVQLHVVHPDVIDPLTSLGDVIDPLTSLGDPVASPLTHVLLHYQGIYLIFLLFDFSSVKIKVKSSIVAGRA